MDSLIKKLVAKFGGKGFVHNRLAQVNFGASVVRRSGLGMGLILENYWKFQCFDKYGNLKWEDSFANLVVTVGLNDSLDKHLKGSSYTAAWYIGLTDGTPTFDAGDTMSSHSGWTEVADYSEANRQTATFGTVAAGSVDNSASPASFSINGSTTVGGAFLVTNNTKSGSTGTLYGGGAFTQGDKSVDSGDTLNVTVTCTAAAS